MSRGNPFIAVRLSPPVMEAVQGASLDQAVPVSDFVRTALQEYLTSLASAAERPQSAPPVNARKVRKVSRPSRVLRLQEEARDLLDDYSAWLEAVPDNLEGSPTTERLREMVSLLEQVCDLLDTAEPPLGYGRD